MTAFAEPIVSSRQPIIARFNDGSTRPQFEVADPGTYNGFIVDVVDQGMVFSSFKGRTQPKVKVVVELSGTADRNGRPIFASRPFTLSLHPMAKLSELIKLLTGKPATADFDLTQLIGLPVAVMLSHRSGDDGSTFMRLDMIWKRDSEEAPSGAYEPWQQGQVKIGRAALQTPEGKNPYVLVTDAAGNEIARLYNEIDMLAAKDASIIECAFRHKSDGTLRIRDKSVKRIA